MLINRPFVTSKVVEKEDGSKEKEKEKGTSTSNKVFCKECRQEVKDKKDVEVHTQTYIYV